MKQYIIENNDIIILVGENAKENWQLLDNSQQNYTWLHLKNLSSPYVIINHSNPSKNILNYAASLCKSHSKFSQLRKIKVIYTQIKNLRKADKEGSVFVKGKCKEIIL
tara:strand:+ start:861 stop:1184 length:324 start_codon:yes stop_codon:yes gene_type:complete